jgi:cytochrome b
LIRQTQASSTRSERAKSSHLAESGGEAASGIVKVWDPFIRWLHWLLVILFAAAWYSGGIWDNPHLVTGYGVTILVLARIVWGFVGSRYARFVDFVYGPRITLRYLADALRMRAPRYLGHNPAGGAMVVTLLATLVVLCATGIMMTMDAFWGVQWVDDLHQFTSDFSLMLIGLHLAGVILASLEYRENLVLAMITGWKRTL